MQWNWDKRYGRWYAAPLIILISFSDTFIRSCRRLLFAICLELLNPWFSADRNAILFHLIWLRLEIEFGILLSIWTFFSYEKSNVEYFIMRLVDRIFILLSHRWNESDSTRKLTKWISVQPFTFANVEFERRLSKICDFLHFKYNWIIEFEYCSRDNQIIWSRCEQCCQPCCSMM